MNDYPPDWDEIATAVKEEADWRCIRCGHPHETPSSRQPCDDRCSHADDGKQRVLTVHHLDFNKANCVWWNLTALCQVCHLVVQAKVVMPQVWPFEHSEWFKPYVAGYYAVTELGLHVDRSTAERWQWQLLQVPELNTFEKFVLSEAIMHSFYPWLSGQAVRGKLA